MNKQKVIVIGSGFAGLSAATNLAEQGFEVTIIEKNEQPGGRASVWKKDGFTFDMGPSWYWMPDVFEKYFEKFGKKPADYFELKRLNPSYRVFFGDDHIADLPAHKNELLEFFEKYEKGAAQKLEKFLAEAKYKYEVGINDLVYRPGNSISEFADIRILKGLLQMDLLKSFSRYIRKYFTNPYLLKLLEFPVLFLGAKPEKTPALYSLMNYADMELGTWYPIGGMHSVVKAMVQLAEQKGVKIILNEEVKSIQVVNNLAKTIITDKNNYQADIVIGGADYHHIESKLLAEPYRNYKENYWKKRTMAPSCILYYVGINKKLKNILHHNLFFDEDFNLHAREIYDTPQWPQKPLFYLSMASATDNTVAPAGCENLVFLIPVAPGLRDTEDIKEKYFEIILNRFEKLSRENIRNNILFKRSYAYSDFVKDYHSFKGNAYGLANTLNQTAVFRPKLRNKKVKNLFYTGQLTVPGPGVPPALISGIVVSNEIQKSF